MSLPACQQRALDTIESTLQRREPRLASMFAMFTRLTTSEGAPRTERLGPSPRRVRLRKLWRLPESAAAARALLLIPLAAILTVVAMFLAMNNSRMPCLPTTGPHGLVASHSNTKNCPSASGFKGFGHGP